MRTKLIALGAIACLAAGTASAKNASKEENVATGAGVVVGAVAGGPVGALVGAAIGAKLGEKYHRRGERAEALDKDLRGSREALSRLESDLRVASDENERLEQQLQELKVTARPQLVALLEAGIEMDLLFRTDEHVLADSTDERLQAMASTLASMPGVSVRLDGFADERGDADYNLQLSQLRADHVRGILVSNGIPSSRITVNARGESVAAEQTIDSYALERKVSLTVFIDDSLSLASAPTPTH